MRNSTELSLVNFAPYHIAIYANKYSCMKLVFMMGFRDLQMELFNFASSKNMLEGLKDQHETFKFTIWILDDMWNNNQDTGFGVDQFLAEHETELMDWYLFVRPYEHGKTIAEIYAEQRDDKELIEVAKKLKSPKYEVVEITDVQKNSRLVCRIFDSGEEIVVRDKNASGRLKVGEGFAAILMPYTSERYISGHALIVSAGRLAEMRKVSSVLKSLDLEIAAFLSLKVARGLSSKTLLHYKMALEGFAYYMRDNPIDNISALGIKHIKGFLKSISKGWLGSYSNYARQNDITATRQFFKYLYKKGKIKEDVSRYLIA